MSTVVAASKVRLLRLEWDRAIVGRYVSVNCADITGGASDRLGIDCDSRLCCIM